MLLNYGMFLNHFKVVLINKPIDHIDHIKKITKQECHKLLNFLSSKAKAIVSSMHDNNHHFKKQVS